MGDGPGRGSRDARPQVKPLVLDDEADGEYRQTVGIYAAENLAVAVRFTEQVEEALERIAAEPHIWPLAPGVHEPLGSASTASIASLTRCCSSSWRPKCGSSRSRTANASPATGFVACRSRLERGRN